MKKFVRGILIGVCILSGYGLVEASSQVDTIDVCYRPKENIKAEIVKDTFDAFREKDSSSIVEKDPIGKTPRYEVEYRNYQLEFKWDSITQCTVTDFNSVIGSATSDYREQIIYCTITYIREIRFKNALIDGTYYDSEKAIQKDDLLGDSTHEYPQLSLTSKRKWPVVIRIRKKLAEGETFKIEGDTCLKNGIVTLKVPERFKDMDCLWKSIGSNDILSSETAHEITVTRQKNILASIVSCEISNGCDNKKDSIKLLPNETPESTITVDIPGGDCLSTAATGTILVTASNPIPGVIFQWDKDGLVPLRPLAITSQKVNYPIQGADNFTVTLTTSGGCQESKATRIVHRNLSGVILRVLDSCPTSGIPFTIATEPPLPNMNLQWTTPTSGFRVINSPTGRKRPDQITMNKTITSDDPSTFTVKDNVCNSSLSKTITVSEPYTAMTAKDNNGNTVKNGDTIAAGAKEITFIAPQHSSITGDNPYSWEVWIYRNPMSSMLPSTGSAERTISVPASARIFVRVSYTSSCRGRESKEYEVYSR